MAHVDRTRIRETTDTEGTGNLVLGGRMRGSTGFAEVMSAGDTCDYVVSYGDVYEEGTGTLNSAGELERTEVSEARHTNGTVDTNRVSLPPGIKTIILTIRSDRFITLRNAVRFDIDQTSRSSGEKAQARSNIGAFASADFFPSGTKMLFQQTAAPTGWTKDTTHNNKALRLVSGSAGSGGSTGFTSVFASRTIVQGNLPNYTLPNTLTINDPGHSHVVGNLYSGVRSGEPGGWENLGNAFTGSTQASFTGVWLSGSITSGGSGIPMDFAVQYVDVIVATKA